MAILARGGGVAIGELFIDALLEILESAIHVVSADASDSMKISVMELFLPAVWRMGPDKPCFILPAANETATMAAGKPDGLRQYVF